MIPNFMNIFSAWVYARGQRVQVGFLCLGVCIVQQALSFDVHIQLNWAKSFSHNGDIIYTHNYISFYLFNYCIIFSQI